MPEHYDLKYGALCRMPNFLLAPMARISRSRSPLAPVALAYLDNMARARALVGLPTNLLAYSFRLDAAVRKVISSREEDRPGDRAALLAAAEREHLVDVVGGIDHYDWVMEDWQPYWRKAEARTAHLTEGVSRLLGREWQGVAAALPSAILGTWTAFEVAAADIWVAAVNAHPVGLAELRGTKGRITKLTRTGQSEAGSAVQGQEAAVKDIKLGAIVKATKGTFDLRGRMGTLLRSRLAFDSLGGIRESFSRAFWTEHDGVDAALSDRWLDALSLVRNVVVHNAGVADDEYATKCGSLPRIPRLAAGDRLKIDGPLTRRLIFRAERRTIDLFEAVDKWLTDNAT